MTCVSETSDTSDISSISFTPCYYSGKSCECENIGKIIVSKKTHKYKTRLVCNKCKIWLENNGSLKIVPSSSQLHALSGDVRSSKRLHRREARGSSTELSARSSIESFARSSTAPSARSSTEPSAGSSIEPSVRSSTESFMVPGREQIPEQSQSTESFINPFMVQQPMEQFIGNYLFPVNNMTNVSYLINVPINSTIIVFICPIGSQIIPIRTM